MMMTNPLPDDDDDDDDEPTPGRRRRYNPPSPPGGNDGGYPGGYPYAPQPPVPVPAPAPPPTIKLAAPDMFSGEQDKLKDWFRQVENHFYITPTKFPTEDLKILFAFSYIRGGKAGEWARHMNENYLNGQARRPCVFQDLVHSWEDLRQKMEERFGDRFEKETARNKLKSLRQAGRYLSEYTQEFYQYVHKAELPEDQLCQAFIRGVSQSLWEMVRMTPLPLNDLQRLVQLFENAENNLVIRTQVEQQRRYQYQPPSHPPPHFQRCPQAPPPRQSAPPPRPVQPPRPQVHRPPVQQRPPPPPLATRPPPPPQPRQMPPGWGDRMDIDRARQKNLCFKCMRPGHMANQCPERGIRTVQELQQETINAIVQAHLDQQKEEEDFAKEVVNYSEPSPLPPTDQTSGYTLEHENLIYSTSPTPGPSRLPTVGEPIFIYPQEETTEEDFY